MVSLEASVVDAIQAAIYSGKATGGELTLHHITPSPDILTTDLNGNDGPSCCDSSHNASANDALIPAFLVLPSKNIPINVLIDTGCLQTNVVSERIATLIRQDGGKLRPANLVLTSGVGGVSYAVQGSINMSRSTHTLETPYP